MHTAKTKLLLLSVLLVSFSILTTGCTNWEKRYQSLNVEHQNIKGLLERERAEKGQLASQVHQGRQTIEELQRQLDEKKTTGQASGFGDQYDVAFDAEKGTVTVTLPNAILFSPGQASLKSARNADLNHIVSVLNSNYSGRQIDIVGHTDSDPISKSSWDDNWELSSQRALSVVRYLINQGIPSDRIRAVGRGESQPIASNANATGKAKNRRVEIVVYMR